MMCARLRSLVVLLLMLALPLQALAAVMPSLLSPHRHATPASTASIEHHTSPHHSDGAAELHRQWDFHGNSVASPDPQGLTDDCSCAWCIACPIPVAVPVRLANLSAFEYALITPHWLYYIPDLLQPPPRV